MRLVRTRERDFRSTAWHEVWPELTRPSCWRPDELTSRLTYIHFPATALGRRVDALLSDARVCRRRGQVGYRRRVPPIWQATAGPFVFHHTSPEAAALVVESGTFRVGQGNLLGPTGIYVGVDPI